MTSRRSYTHLRQELLKAQSGRCAICGATDVPLELDHIMPRAVGGTDDIANLQLVCRTCNMHKGAYWPRETEFVAYLARLLEGSVQFKDVRREPVLSGQAGYRADLTATRILKGLKEKLVIECKASSSFTSSRLVAVTEQLREYRRNLDVSFTQVLAFPGRIAAQDASVLLRSGIELWDVDYISAHFADGIARFPHPFYGPLFGAALAPRAGEKERRLLADIKNCPPGRESWSRYQQLAGRVLEDLFCPPLRQPIPESSDATRTNRRDYILPNYAPEGYWSFLRSTYAADYVVVDAKNYKGKVKKQDALQIANYLKAHGAGLFGLILCRTSGDAGCTVTLREQWMTHRKLVLVLSDGDLESMLLAKSTGGSPEEILLQRIEEFRLSL